MGKNPSPNYYLTDTLVSRYSSLKPDLLADILQDIDRIALKIIDLKKAFPNTNISAMAARHPAILLEDIRNVLEQAKKVQKIPLYKFSSCRQRNYWVLSDWMS